MILKATSNKNSKISDTVRIHSRYGSHFVTHSDLLFRYNSDTLQTRKSFYYSFRIQSQDTVQIHSRPGSHFVTHSDSNYQIQIRYATETEAILFSHSDSAINFKFRYTPDTEVILLLRQISTSDTVQIRSIHGSHAVTYSDFFPNSEMLHNG